VLLLKSSVAGPCRLYSFSVVGLKIVFRPREPLGNRFWLASVRSSQKILFWRRFCSRRSDFRRGDATGSREAHQSLLAFRSACAPLAPVPVPAQ
jgi:hypothetical protein